jgi:general secretion pathway protein B
MSYHLDALRKAERERNLGQVPSLESAQIPLAPSRQRWWLWTLALVILANAVVLTMVYFYSQSNSAIAQATTSDLPAAKPEAIEPGTRPELSEPAPATTASTDTATQMSAAESETFPIPAEPLGLPTLPPAEFAASRNGFDEMPGWRPPPLQAMPSEFRRAMPPINVDVHVYSEDPEKRFVLVNSKPYREGDHLDEGPFLETISEQGTILSYQGQRFVIPVHR